MDDHVSPARLASFAEYADRHEIYDLFSNIVARLVVDRPNDPLSYIIDYLGRPAVPAVVFLGPPSANRSAICKKVAEHLGYAHVHTGQLLRSAVEKGTALGTQAKPYMESNQLVPDTVMFNLVSTKLTEDKDCLEKGWILDGYPRTREQALQLQRKGIMPTHVVVLDIPDETIVSHTTALRVDPVTGTEYHLVQSPPQPGVVASRVTQRSHQRDDAVRARLGVYRRHLYGVLACYGRAVRTFAFPHGVYDHDATSAACTAVKHHLAQRSPTSAPREFRIAVAGLPGSGKTTISKLLADKYGFVHVSPKSVILEQQSRKGAAAAELAQYGNTPEDAPAGALTALIVDRLNRADCAERGWVLDGFPFTKVQADEMRTAGISPNRVIFVDCPPATCAARLTQRRYDVVTGRCINLAALPVDLATLPPSALDGFAQRAEDEARVVEERIAKCAGIQGELQAAYGVRGGPSEQGLVYTVPSDGLGESDGRGVEGWFSPAIELAGKKPVYTAAEKVAKKTARSIAPTVLKAFETVDASLMRPVPLEALDQRHI